MSAGTACYKVGCAYPEEAELKLVRLWLVGVMLLGGGGCVWDRGHDRGGAERGAAATRNSGAIAAICETKTRVGRTSSACSRTAKTIAASATAHSPSGIVFSGFAMILYALLLKALA